MKNLRFPVAEENFGGLNAGDRISLSGTIYAARDAAHEKMVKTIEEGFTPPFTLQGSLIYYMGPSPAPKDSIIGACGPTTSSRMDIYTEPLLKKGLKATMGKGERSEIIRKSCIQYRALYIVTFGGCGAYLRKFVEKSEVIAYPELGPEAIYKLSVKDFPALIGIDIKGNNIYNK